MENLAYYSKNDVLNEAITPQHEKKLFKRFYAGNPDDMSKDALEARDLILKSNLRYAALTAMRHASRRSYHQELISAANLGLMKALESRRHDPERGRFTTFATKYIIGEICACFRVACSVTFPAGQLPDWPEDGIEEPDVENLADPSSFTPADIDHEALHKAIASLPETERQMIEHIFFYGENVTGAARLIVRNDGKIGVSRQWATDLRNAALAKLRIAMGAAMAASETEEVETEVAA